MAACLQIQKISSWSSSWHGSWQQVGCQGSGAVAENLHLINRQEAERVSGLLEPTSSPLVTHLLQQGHGSLSFLNSLPAVDHASYNEPAGAIFIQTNTVTHLVLLYGNWDNMLHTLKAQMPSNICTASSCSQPSLEFPEILLLQPSECWNMAVIYYTLQG